MVRIIFRQPNGTEKTVNARAGETLMINAKAAGVDGIVAECGGSMVCGTCHVYIAEPWFSRLDAAPVMEAEMLEYGLYPQPTSRLACQIEVTPELDGMVVSVPLAQR